MTNAATIKPQEYRESTQQLAGWKVHIVSYRLGDVYCCTVDNVDPGARLVRTQAATREEAERQALERAGQMLVKTRKF